jgi:hypothetical protein
MIAMQIIEPKFCTNTREHRSGRCDGSNYRDKHSDFWLFTVSSTISFASVDTSFELLIIGC